MTKYKKHILSDITKLLLMKKKGDFVSAKSIFYNLQEKLKSDNTSWGIKQKQLLEKIKNSYNIDCSSLILKDTNFVKISVDEFVQHEIQGTSLVTCCMNREENLLKVLPKWLQFKEINQVVIVDWSSKKTVRDVLQSSGIRDSRILVVRVNNQNRWILSYAYNLGFRISQYDKILKTDSDIIIQPNFFEENVLKEGTFLSGDWRKAEKGQEHINGFFYIYRRDLLSVKGFNEYITTYGWDDDDLYFRLEQHGLNRIRIKSGSIYHMPHSDSQRLSNSKELGKYKNALDELIHNTGMKIMGNRFLSGVMPLWDHNKFFVHFTITKISANYLEAEQIGDSIHQVPAHIQRDMEYYGLVNAVSWTTELTAFHISKENFYELLRSRKRCADITIADVRLSACAQCNTVDWHRYLLILEFANDVPLDEKSRIIKKLYELSNKHSFSIVVDSDLLSNLDLKQESEIKNIVARPSGFYTQGLYNCELQLLETEDLLIDLFNTEPVIVLKLNKSNLQNTFFKNKVNLKKKYRFYVHVQHGLGNRLRALASAAVISEKTDRELVVIWTPDIHCQCRLHDLFDYKGIVLEYTDNIDFNNIDYFTYMEIEPNACKDAPINLKDGRDLYIRTAYVINHSFSTHDDENKVLRSLKPVKEVLDIVNSIEVNGRIGVHIRMEGSKGTDTNIYDSSENWLPESHAQINYWRGQSHYQRFINKIDSIIDLNHNATFFLASDTEEPYNVLSKRYGNRFAMLKRNVFDRSTQQLKFALADAILLSRCDYLLGSTWSSFTELALRLSTTIKKVELSGKDF